MLLTDEEILGLDYTYTGTFKYSREVDMWVKQVVAKAQVKKFFDVISKLCKEEDKDLRLCLGYIYMGLLKEVE